MKKNGNILIVDDNRNVLTALQLLLKPYFNRIELLPSPVTLPSVLRETEWNVLLLDMNFTSGINNGNEGLYWLHEVLRLRPKLPVVLFTAYADIDLAVRGIKEGATDFVVKPWDNQKLTDTLLKAASPARSRQEERPAETPDMYWGESSAMLQLRKMVEKVAATDANVLITGENGTGKEMLARELHRLSQRDGHPMVTVDMGAVTETLFESELFGHVKGAFTDARSDRAGKFEIADGGTLFLDEIGNLPLHLQPKLLSALQNGTVVRVGSNLPVKVDCRLVSATNRNLFNLVAEGAFREDLLYRINTIHIDLPPLRQRREDIIPLARMFLARYAAKYRKSIRDFDRAARQELAAHAWPGNIRELQHTVEKAVILCDGSEITPQTLLLHRVVVPAVGPETFTTFEQMERAMIERAMARHGGNLSAVAQQLGVTRQTLYNKIKRYGL